MDVLIPFTLYNKFINNFNYRLQLLCLLAFPLSCQKYSKNLNLSRISCFFACTLSQDYFVMMQMFERKSFESYKYCSFRKTLTPFCKYKNKYRYPMGQNQESVHLKQQFSKKRASQKILGKKSKIRASQVKFTKKRVSQNFLDPIQKRALSRSVQLEAVYLEALLYVI